MLDAQRYRQLQALGLVPMRLRSTAQAETCPESISPAARTEPAHSTAHSTTAAASAPANGARTSASPTNTPSTAPAIPVHLWCPAQEGDAFSGPHTRLLQQLLRCLGLAPEHIQPGLPDGNTPAILLAFGPGAPEGATRLAALGQLRDPIEKRIAWPHLRRLRKQLRQRTQ